ncbi:acyltransferase family protein [bacterium]|nr:acyltransferase family protein [bacterium]
MPSSLDNSHDRLVFFDDLRFFIIMFVVLQHIALVYGAETHGSAVSGAIFNYIVMLTDIFMMPVLFFAAGFFALPSIERYGTAHFVVNKLKRLGIPQLIGAVFIVPVAMYFMYCSRVAGDGTPPVGYWNYWIEVMKSAVTFHSGYVHSPDQFSLRHLWFLSVLLSVLILFAGLYKAEKESAFIRNTLAHIPKTHSAAGMFTVLLITGLITSVGFFIVKLYLKWGYQAVLVFNLIHFEPSRLVSQIVFFALGVYAYSAKWFAEGRSFGSIGIWTGVSLLALIVHIHLDNSLPAPLTVFNKCLLSFSRSFLALFLFGGLVSFARRFWNRPSPVHKVLAANSYTVYVIHYPLPALSAILLNAWNVHVLVKSGTAFGLTVLISMILSNYLVKPYPRLAVGSLILLNVVLFMIL